MNEDIGLMESVLGLMPAQFQELILEIEEIFALVSYNEHTYNLKTIIQDAKDIGDERTREGIIFEYKEQLKAICKAQGITISEIENLRTHLPVIRAICEIGSGDVRELFEGQVVPDEETDLETFCALVGKVAGLDLTEVMPIIYDVESEVVEYIIDTLELEEIAQVDVDEMTIRAQKREEFMAYGERMGVVWDAVSSLGHMNYDAGKTFIMIKPGLEELLEAKETLQVAKEIKRFLIGSNEDPRLHESQGAIFTVAIAEDEKQLAELNKHFRSVV